MAKLTDEEKRKKRLADEAQRDKDDAERRRRNQATRDAEAAARKKKKDAQAERDAEYKATMDRIAADKKAADARIAAQLAASEKQRKADAKAAEARRKQWDIESAERKKAEKALLDEGAAMRKQWAADDEKRQKEDLKKKAAAEKKIRDDELQAEKVRNRIAQNSMKLVDDKQLSTAGKAAAIIKKAAPKYAGSGLASAGFKPSAGAQISSLLSAPHIAGYPSHGQGALPALMDHSAMIAHYEATSPFGPSQEFTVPKSKQSWINRVTGGRFDRPRPPPPGGGDGGDDGPGFFRRGKNRWDRGVDSLAGVRDSVEEAHGMRTSDKLFAALKGNIMPAALGGTVMAGTAALGAMGGALDLVKKAFFSTWEYIDTKVLPTQSMLNRALGTSTTGMTGLRKEAMSTGLQFEALGLGFEHGAQSVKDIAVAMKSADISKSGMKDLITASEYVGLGGTGAGELGRSFQAAGLGIDDMAKAFQGAQVAADEFNVPVALIQKEFGENRDALARWGAENSLQFSRAIARAQHYGLSINDLESSFGESMDSFENTSDIASKINQAFGTNLDSIKLMNASDEDRMEMVQKAIKNTGFVWTAQTKYYNNLLKASLGLKDNDAGLRMFGTEATSKEAKKRVDEQAALAKGTAAWNKGLSSLGTQLVSIEQMTRKFFMAIGDVVARLLGFDSGIDATKTGVKAFAGFIDHLTDKIEEFAHSIPADGSGGGLNKFFNDANSFVQNLNSSISGTLDLLEDVRSFGTNGFASSMSDRFAEAVKNNDDKALAQLNTEVHTPTVFGNQMQAYYQKAARKAHMSEADVQQKMEGGMLNKMYGKPSDAIPEGYGVLQNSPTISPIVNVYIDSEKVAAATTKASVRRAHK